MTEGRDLSIPRGRHAVLAQRTEPAEASDDFPTPPWATRALIKHILVPQVSLARLRIQRAWEPAAGSGAMVTPLRETFKTVVGTDAIDYGAGFKVFDFLSGPRPRFNSNWIITNPPFNKAHAFIEQALSYNASVAILARLQLLEGVGRYQRIYRTRWPQIVAPFTERVPIVKGRLTATGSTATAYAWFVWLHEWSHRPTMVQWIPPCRGQLEFRLEDYPED